MNHGNNQGGAPSGPGGLMNKALAAISSMGGGKGAPGVSTMLSGVTGQAPAGHASTPPGYMGPGQQLGSGGFIGDQHNSGRQVLLQLGLVCCVRAMCGKVVTPPCYHLCVRACVRA